jgi:HisA/HisF family protein
MKIVPVIDIKDGVVVRAIGGERATYRAIVTPLSKSSRPSDVIDDYLRLFPFDAIYVADLNAIEGAAGVNDDAVAELARFHHLRFWIDRGASWQPGSLPSGSFERVIGSETLSNADELRALARDARALLSLDFRGGEFLGSPEVLAHAEFWPERVIVMTLARVGKSEGPDFERVLKVVRRAEGRDVFAAGGVRDARDLKALAEAGVAGALIASALHGGALSAADLRQLQKNEKGSR